MAKLKDKLWKIILALFVFVLIDYIRFCIVKGSINPYHIKIPKINISISFDDDKKENNTSETMQVNSKVIDEKNENEIEQETEVKIEDTDKEPGFYLDTNDVYDNNNSSNTSNNTVNSEIVIESNSSAIQNINPETIVITGE